MKIETDKNGSIVLKEIFSGVYLESREGNKLAVVMRHDGFEIRVLPKDGKSLPWAIVNLETGQADSVANPRPLTNNTTIAWAVGRWNQEVKNRPLVNIHRRTLDDTWRQVIQRHGGNPNQLLGPTHDQLVWLRDNPTEKVDLNPDWVGDYVNVWEAPSAGDINDAEGSIDQSTASPKTE